MQSENFDKKIIEAAENHHPNYDENAWAKMEALLDEHMPTKEKRKRRILFFFLLFLFAGGASWLMIKRPWEERSMVSRTEASKEVRKDAESTGGNGRGGSTTIEGTGSTIPGPGNEGGAIPNTDNKDNSAANDSSLPAEVRDREQVKGPAGTTKESKVTPTGKTRDGYEGTGGFKPIGTVSPKSAGSASLKKSRKTEKKIVDEKNNRDESIARITPPGKKDDPAPERKEVISPTEGKNEPVANQPLNPQDRKVSAITPPKDSIEEKKNALPGEEVTAQPKENEKEEVKPKETEITQAQKKSGKKEKQPNSFFISASAAPDISMVGMDRIGKLRLVAGIGVGYTFHDRLTIRTGFYAGNKVYDADPTDYKPESPPPNIDYLYRIDADCRVFEIPLSLSYNFLRKPKYKAFAGAGISSFIMKKESYDYVYKYPGSDDEHIYNWTINDENRHLFSVLTFSAGYERVLGKRLSIAAEPYLKLPLAGVGFGKVKLKSAGLMFSVNYKPFTR